MMIVRNPQPTTGPGGRSHLCSRGGDGEEDVQGCQGERDLHNKVVLAISQSAEFANHTKKRGQLSDID